VLLANQITDPQWEWPLTSQQFNLYLNDKYSTVANSNTVLSYTQSTIQQYVKTITTTDSISSNTTSLSIIVDQPTYTLIQTGSTTQTFSDGSSVTETITKNAVSIYDYEINLNESKRNIQLINKNYAYEFEKQLHSLLGM
jgi:formate dehydrogenase assembly factor FdhD